MPPFSNGIIRCPKFVTSDCYEYSFQLPPVCLFERKARISDGSGYQPSSVMPAGV